MSMENPKPFQMAAATTENIASPGRPSQSMCAEVIPSRPRKVLRKPNCASYRRRHTMPATTPGITQGRMMTLLPSQRRRNCRLRIRAVPRPTTNWKNATTIVQTKELRMTMRASWDWKMPAKPFSPMKTGFGLLSLVSKRDRYSV